MPTLVDHLKGQIAPLSDGPIKAHAINNLDAVQRVATEVATEIARINADINLSPAGKTSKAIDAIKPHLHHVMRSDSLIESASAKLCTKESGLVSSSTFDAKRAPIRSEMRAVIKSMTRGDHIAAINDPNVDVEVLESIVEAPSMLHGVDTDLRDVAAKRLATIRNPTVVAQIQHNREGLQVVRTTADALRDQIGETLGVRNRRVVNALVAAHIPDRRHIDADVMRAIEAI